ncbi:MAG: hypothetical protein ACHQET_11040 [Chitinophagales bacterium]
MLNQQDAEKSDKEIRREHGFSNAIYYNWRDSYTGMAVIGFIAFPHL